MYDYQTPPGYGDSFFIYAFNGLDNGLVNASSYSLLGIPVTDGEFICRGFSGPQLLLAASNLATDGTVQVYDTLTRGWFQLPVSPLLYTNRSTTPSPGSGMQGVLPEKKYYNNANIRFDLKNVSMATNVSGVNSVAADQMAFYGVRRIRNGRDDPGPSNYDYYEKPFTYPTQITINKYGVPVLGGAAVTGLPVPDQYTIQIQDFDFELRYMTFLGLGGTNTTGSFQILVPDEFLSGILFTAAAPGANTTTVTITDHTLLGPNAALSVVVVGNAVTINVATNGAGVATSSTNSIIAALIASAPAMALLTPTLIGDGTLGVIQNPFGPISLSGTGSGAGSILPYASPFKILLYDNNWVQRMNIPILAELACRQQNARFTNNNYLPAPPILYKANSVIRFDIFSLIPFGAGLPVTIDLAFTGIRRIRCR